MGTVVQIVVIFLDREPVAVAAFQQGGADGPVIILQGGSQEVESRAWRVMP